jgi:hypothetical protein
LAVRDTDSVYCETVSYETDERLKNYLDTNQLARERLCLAVLAIDKRFSQVKPRHPRGGPDEERDIEAVFRGAQSAFAAVGFLNQANDSSEHRKRAMRKFENDLNAALVANPKLEVFVFFTNVDLKISEQTDLEDYARKKGIKHCEIFYRERIRIALDSPDGFSTRYQYLSIPLSEAEQATFFAKWGDDIQGLISNGFGQLERTLNRLQFLAETNLPLSHFTIILDLDREYLGSEIGHFRAFCSLELVEPKERVVGLLFGSTDDPNRRNASAVNELNLAFGGIERGTYGRQWKEKLREGADIPDPFEKTRECLVPAGSFTAVGLPRARRLAIQFRDADDFIRIPPYLLMRDIDDARFALFLNQSLADKLAAVSVYANEYELAKYSKSALRIDRLPGDFQVPMCFADSELADVWVCVRDDRSSSFHISFSDSTPRRRFSAIEVAADDEERRIY